MTLFCKLQRSSEMCHFWSAQVLITQLLHCKHTTPAFTS